MESRIRFVMSNIRLILALNGVTVKIIAIMMDNATNDTMMQCIKTHCHEIGIIFHPDQAWMQCMPHTIHLATIKVCFND